jgi:hypothetical protein
MNQKEGKKWKEPERKASGRTRRKEPEETGKAVQFKYKDKTSKP